MTEGVLGRIAEAMERIAVALEARPAPLQGAPPITEGFTGADVAEGVARSDVGPMLRVIRATMAFVGGEGEVLIEPPAMVALISGRGPAGTSIVRLPDGRQAVVDSAALAFPLAGDARAAGDW